LAEPLSSLLATINRARPPLPAAVVIANAAGMTTLMKTILNDWSGALETIDQRIAELTQRREMLLRERRELLLDALDPGPPRAALDKIDRALAVLDTDLTRLGDARAVASWKLAQERDAAARRQHLEAVAKFDTAIEALEQRAAALDARTLDYARAVIDFANACETARRLCPGRLPLHPGDHLLGFDRAVTAVRRNLRAAGCAWAWSAEYPPPPTIAATIAEGAAWARTYPAENRFNPET
jgi:hypothetical protein